MILKTSIFALYDGKYNNLSELAQAMGISVSQIYRVREDKRNINQKFLIGAINAFPGDKLDDLFLSFPLSCQMSLIISRIQQARKPQMEKQSKQAALKRLI